MNKPRKANILKVYGREPETLDELARCVITMVNSTENVDMFRRSRPSVDTHKVVGFAWDIKYRPEVSITHSSPEGYPENFGCKAGLPKSYPGWAGRVWIRYAEECRGFGSDAFCKTLTHTGTGGFGTYDGPWEGIARSHFQRFNHGPNPTFPRPECFSWDFRFYNLDWPVIADWVDQQEVWSRLSEKPWDKSHKFSWTDPHTLIKDSEFIAECATIKAKETA